MKNTCVDISNKIKNSDFNTDVVKELYTAANEFNIEFVLIGATARDIVLKYICGYSKIRRATADIDFAILVPDWGEFGLLINKLISGNNFTKTDIQHRLSYKELLPVDIIPFGEISDNGKTIKWPPGYTVEMSVVGLKEAFETAYRIKFAEPELIIRVANLTGLFLTKLIAWDDRKDSKRLDYAADIDMFLENYLDDKNYREQIDGADIDITKISPPDYSIMSARLLGRNLARISSAATLREVILILKKQTNENSNLLLIRQMLNIIAEQPEIIKKRDLLVSILNGIDDIKKVS